MYFQARPTSFPWVRHSNTDTGSVGRMSAVVYDGVVVGVVDGEHFFNIVITNI